MSEIKLRAVDPVRITLRDGTSVELLLTFGILRRLRDTTGVASISEMLQRDPLDSIRLIYECIRNRPPELTLERFEELLPTDFAGISQILAELVGMPSERPLPAAATESQTG